jgi:ribosomal protein S18 acetylase RimI-like enzyme
VVTRALDTIYIRLATVDDGPALAALAERLAHFDLPPWREASAIATADTREMMSAVRAAAPDNEVFVAERGAEVVGCLHVLATVDFFGTRHAHISVLATTTEAEGTGVGRALLEYAEAWARARQHPLITLNVFAANERARRFYERGGLSAEIMRYIKPLG